MLTRHRRRPYLIGMEDGKKPRTFLRFMMVIATGIVLWYGSSAILRFFDQSVGRKTAATLEMRSRDGVQVALQKGDWQAAETKLKIYAGDAVSTRSAGDAILRFFDGTRIRLDQNTELEVITSDSIPRAISTIDVRVRSGRIWVQSPTQTVFSGSIVRRISTTNFWVDVSPDTSMLVSNQILNVVRASGIGAHVTFSVQHEPSIVVGEGQYLSLEGDAITSIEEGRDPYDYRDPVTTDQLQDDFVVSSILIMGATETIVRGTDTTLPDINAGTILEVVNPAQRAEINAKTVTVTGRVGGRVTRVLINGQAIALKNDLSFSAEITLSREPTLAIIVEAQDAQGITLGREERSIINTYKVIVEPPRITSPAGSGETITVSHPVVEVTGEAPPETAAIVVNDYRLQLFKPGNKTWSYLANAAYGNLRIGENKFTVVALDANENRSAPRTVTVIYEPTNQPSENGTGSTVSTAEPALKQNPPLQPNSLVVNLPNAGTSAETPNPEISITGLTSADTYSISVNGYTLSLYQPYSTSWKYIASVPLTTMKRGRNVYRIVSRNKGGEILDVLEYTITFTP